MDHPALTSVRVAAATLSLALACTLGCNRGADVAPTGGKSAVAGPRQIVALGRLEPAGGILEISAIPGDVLKNYAENIVEGAIVASGAELARVNSYDLRSTQLEAVDAKLKLGQQQREQELALANANYQQALARKAEVEAKLEEIEAQGDALGSLAEAAQIANADFEKIAELQASDPELVSERQMRRQRNQADQAVREYEVRRRTHEAAQKAAIAAVNAATESVRAAQLNLRLAEDIDRNTVTEIERKIAQTTLEQSVLRAPAAAPGGSGKFTVLKILLEPGEFVTQIPVMQIGDLSRMVCIAEVYEADVKEVVVGQKVTIRSPAFSGKYADGDANGSGSGGMPGKVTRVGTLVSTAGLMQRNPLAPSDRSIVEVEIAIEGDTPEATSAATAEAGGHIGLQVTVQFGAKPSAGNPAPPSSEEPL